MKIIGQETIEQLIANAETSERRRAHHNLHDDLDDPVQRLCLFPQLHTYCRAHRHPYSWELMAILKGAIRIFTFDDAGRVSEIVDLEADNGNRIIQLEPMVFHTFVTIKKDSMVMEVKKGPYLPNTDEHTAHFMPPEGDDRAPFFESFLHRAHVGDDLSSMGF